MSDYQDYIKAIEQRIHRNHMLQEAQIPDSAHALRYQERIESLTDLLHRFEQAAPHLRELDQQILAAEADLDDAFAATDRRAEPWPQLGAWTGGLGAVGLLAGLGLGLPWQVTAVAVLLLVVAAGSVAMQVRSTRDGTDELRRAQDELGALQEERAALMPSLDALMKESV